MSVADGISFMMRPAFIEAEARGLEYTLENIMAWPADEMGCTFVEHRRHQLNHLATAVLIARWIACNLTEESERPDARKFFRISRRFKARERMARIPRLKLGWLRREVRRQIGMIREDRGPAIDLPDAPEL
jgi:hypothetical protein